MQETCAVIFDLDGTLVDSAPDIHASVNEMLIDEGFGTFTLPEIISFIGNGLPALIEKVMAARSIAPQEFQRLHDDVLQRYLASEGALTQIYPDVVSNLRSLKSQGIKMGICTNKPEGPARHLLDILDLTQFFDVIIGGDTLSQRKPAALPLRTTIEHLRADRVLYVGDSEVDAATAQAAGIAFALFTEGYRKTDASEIPHDVLFSSFTGFTEQALKLLAVAPTD